MKKGEEIYVNIICKLNKDDKEPLKDLPLTKIIYK